MKKLLEKWQVLFGMQFKFESLMFTLCSLVLIIDSGYCGNILSDLHKDKCLLKYDPQQNQNPLHSNHDIPLTSDVCRMDSCKIFPRSLIKLVRMHRCLYGAGSHRNLVSLITFDTQSDIAWTNISEPACEAVMLERLPSGVFADIYEFQHYVHRGVFMAAAIFGDTNVELPSVLSNCSVVKVQVDLGQAELLQKLGRELEISVEVPLHARYPPLCKNGYFKVEFGAPELLIRCRLGKSDPYCFCVPIVWDLESTPYEKVMWQIACGNEAHAGMVTAITMLTALLCGFSVVMAAVSSASYA